MREIVEGFFRERSIVNHHIASYNDFLPTIDHPNSRMQKIVDMGALPKGVQPALVDFPSHLEGREVYLCWKLGDKKLTHSHGTDEGFANRRPLPKRRR